MVDRGRTYRMVDAWTDVAARLDEMYTWPEWMGAYFPDEAAEALRDMERRESLVEAFYFIRDWMGRVLDELEDG